MTMPSTMAQKLRDNIQTYAHGRVESEWEYRDAEQIDLQPLIYSTSSERKDDAMALSLYAVRFCPLDIMRMLMCCTRLVMAC